MNEIWIYGIGNVGEKYSQTKHNIGRIIVERLAKQMNVGWKKASNFVDTAEVSSQNVKLIFLRSLGYMNESGKPLRTYLEYRKSEILPLILIVQDDSDQLVGHAKLTIGGGTAGHWGIDSIYKEMLNYASSQDFLRLKIGVRPDLNRSKSETFVLSAIDKRELEFVTDLAKVLLLPETLLCLRDREYGKLQTLINSFDNTAGSPSNA